MNEQSVRESPKVFVRKYREESPLPSVRIYVKWLPFLTHPDAVLFQNEMSRVLENVVTVRLHEFYIVIEWMPLDGSGRENDDIQEVVIDNFIAFLQRRRNWQAVEREDFEFDQLNEIARREDRVYEWHPNA
jgi:hypothetical protein